jgi:alpha-1,6-mannosyltransferase
VPLPHPLTRWRLLGLGGTILVAASGAGIGVFPRPDPWSTLPVISSLRSAPWGAPLSVTLFVIGITLLVGAWARLGLEIARGTQLTARWLAMTTAVWSVPLAVAPPMFSRDVYSYAAQGQLFANGIDPYGNGVDALGSDWIGSVDPIWRDTPAPYGPLFMSLARSAVQLSSGSLIASVFLLRLVAIIGVVLVAIYLPRLARASMISEAWSVWLGLASPLLLLHSVGGAHNDTIMLGLIVAGLAWAVRGRPAVGTVLVALAVAVKATSVVVVPFLAVLWAAQAGVSPDRVAADNRPGRATGVGTQPTLRQLVRACVLTAVIAAATFGLISAVSGLGLGWVNALGTPGLSAAWTSLPTGLGMFAHGVARLFGAGPDPKAILAVSHVLGIIAMFVILVVLWWRVRFAGDSPRRVILACGWALLAVVVLAPALHPWYLPNAVTVIAAATWRPRIRLGLAAVCAGMCFVAMPNGLQILAYMAPTGIALEVGVMIWAAAIGIRRARTHWRATRSGSRPVAVAAGPEERPG